MKQPYIPKQLSYNSLFPNFYIHILRIYAAFFESHLSHKTSRKLIDQSIYLGMKYLSKKSNAKILVHHLCCENANNEFILSGCCNKVATTSDLKFQGNTIIQHDREALEFMKKFSKTKFLHR